MKGGIIEKDVVAVYKKFLQSGRPINKSEHPNLDKQKFTALVKFILPIVSPNEAIYLSYSYKLKSKQRL